MSIETNNEARCYTAALLTQNHVMCNSQQPYYADDVVISGSLMCAWDQQNAFRSFLAPPLLAKPGHLSAQVVVDWFAEFSKPTKWVILLSYPLALAFALANIFFGAVGAGAGLHPQTKAFYVAGGLLSILHFYFGSWSMMWNARIDSKVNVGQANEDALRGWLENIGARMM